MPRISRSSLLISIAIMIAVVAAACDSPASKPTAEPGPPTPIPTVTTEAAAANADTARQGIADLDVQECLAGELDLDIDPATGVFDRGLLREVDAADLTAAFEACGVEQGGGQAGGFGGRLGGGFVGSGIADPEVRACLTEEMGEDALDNLGQGSGVGLGEEWAAAFEKCGLGFGDGATPFGGGRGGGGFAGGGAFANPEVQECLTNELGEDFGSEGGGILGGFTGGGLSEELTAAFEECGIDLTGGLGGRLGGGGFGGGGRVLGGGGFGGDGSFRECITEALGEDALLLLRNPDGPSAELQEVLQECGNEVEIPAEEDSGTDDGAGPDPIEPTATAIPVNALTYEQLKCLSSELEPGDLASAVAATSSGDISKVSDTVLAALQTCGVGS